MVRRLLRGNRRGFALGLTDQTLQSGMTVTLMIGGGRSLGPSGLGAIALGFAALLIPVAVQRALIVDPYVTEPRSSRDDSASYASALTLTLLLGAATSILFGAIALALNGAGAEGVRGFAPWVIPFLVQALFRPAVFRHGKGGRAVIISVVALALFWAALLAGMHHSISQVTSAWGLGLTASAILTVIIPPIPHLATVRSAWLWFKQDALPFGRWLGLSSASYTACNYAMLASLAAVLGPAGVGAYRAIESVFSPLSLIAPGLSNPGVHALRTASDRHQAFRTAAAISLVAAATTVTYACVLSIWKGSLSVLFGPQFRNYVYLIPPIALAQTLAALSVGFILLLKVARRGRLYVPIGLLTPVTALVTGPLLAYFSGLEGAAWGIGLCAGLSTVWAMQAARRTAVGAQEKPGFHNIGSHDNGSAAVQATASA